jgi:predicted transcriptional regulator
MTSSHARPCAPELARRLERDRTAVKRDVQVLLGAGLVRTREVVEPLAEKYELLAVI